MSKNQKKKPGAGGWFKNRGKKRTGKKLNAYVSNEHDWESEVPNMNLSKVFAVVLGLHIIAVLGIIGYEFFRDEDPLQSPFAQARQAALDDGVAVG